MDIQEFLSLAVVGGLLSWSLEYLTSRLDSTFSKLTTIIGALIVGGLYTWAVSTPYWETVLQVLVSASTIYAFFIKK